jgi:hypothetical protein
MTCAGRRYTMRSSAKHAEVLLCDAATPSAAVDHAIANTSQRWHDPAVGGSSTINTFRLSNPGVGGWVSSVLIAAG